MQHIFSELCCFIDCFQRMANFVSRELDYLISWIEIEFNLWI